MTNCHATTEQVRAFYKEAGYQVRISKDGHITFRLLPVDTMWREGRWVSEYRIIDGEVTLR